jgi:predicted nucleotidyltransferase
VSFLEPLPPALVDLIGSESATQAAPSISAVAEAARRRHGIGIVAVLFYGSCLRGSGDIGNVVDLYLLADSYRTVHRGPLMRILNRLLPPNVYYIETPFGGRTVRAKYALLALEQFERLVEPSTLQSYFWARFAQPTSVIWAREPAIRERITRALATAVLTTAHEARALLDPDAAPAAIWARAFREAYRTELRAEAPERGIALYEAFAGRYDAITSIIQRTGTVSPADAGERRRRAERKWRRRRMVGKTLSVLRLMKSAFTFEDGATYLIWKIERHSGVRFELTPWQKRHPILASGTLFWRIYRAGGFR